MRSAVTTGLLVPMVAAACVGGQVTLATDTDDATTQGPSGPSSVGEAEATSSMPPPPVTTLDGVATTDAGDVDDMDDATDDDAMFIMPCDCPGDDCDLFAQDCPQGEKCMPWSNDGGSVWNATRCVPIVDDPGQEGDACSVAGSPLSGMDTCDLGHMCWHLDQQGNGICENMCTGSPDNPICDADEYCTVSGEGVINLCLPTCDPIAQDCELAIEACYPSHDIWHCVPDASARSGVQGDPCEFINACDPGLACVNAASVPDCGNGVGCCTQLCNVFDAGSDSLCASLHPMLTCLAWYEPGTAPAGYAHVGVCVLP